MSTNETRFAIPPAPLPGLSKSEYKQRVSAVRAKLLKLQFRLREADFPVLLVFGGVDGGGKHETINLLHEWLDPRYLKTMAYVAPSEEEQERPRMWRYWRDLPVRGQIGLVLSGWYTQPLLDYVNHRSDQQRFEQQLMQVRGFEQMLADDGAVILKFWMYLSAEQQHKRLRTLADDPLTIWQIKPQDWKHLHMYQRFIQASQHLLEQTHSAQAPWQVIDGSQARERHLQVAECLAQRLQQALDGDKSAPRITRFRPTSKRRLDSVDLAQRLDKAEYSERLKSAQSQLLRLHQMGLHTQRSTVVVFEGWDAAGKGGAIRRMVRPLDARHYKLVPVGAPNDEERAHHYLWRFWRHLPRAGHLCVFDRSWYGRVLVERVEQLASAQEWQRAYKEIQLFEQSLVESGTRLIKFWLHISDDEQLARFQARESDPLKSWKLTDEGWRNRSRRPEYCQAVDDMLARTSTSQAPWVVVAANDKRHARVQVIEALCQHMLRY